MFPVYGLGRIGFFKAREGLVLTFKKYHSQVQAFGMNSFSVCKVYEVLKYAIFMQFQKKDMLLRLTRSCCSFTQIEGLIIF